MEGEDEIDLSRCKFGKELEGCRCLNVCELHLILGDQLRQAYKRPAQATDLIRQCHAYAAKFSKIKLRQAVADSRSTLEKHQSLAEFELSALINLMPRSAEETKILIPSMSRFDNLSLNEFIDELESFRIYTS